MGLFLRCVFNACPSVVCHAFLPWSVGSSWREQLHWWYEQPWMNITNRRRSVRVSETFIPFVGLTVSRSVGRSITKTIPAEQNSREPCSSRSFYRSYYFSCCAKLNWCTTGKLKKWAGSTMTRWQTTQTIWACTAFIFTNLILCRTVQRFFWSMKSWSLLKWVNITNAVVL